jgi:rhodanese-related sulfurtransferase
MKIIKAGMAVVFMGLLTNLFVGDRADKETNIPALIKDGALVIDTRSPGEFSGGHIAGAINIPHNIISKVIAQHTSNKSRSIIVYCHSGGRSAAAKQTLEQAGYTHVVNGGSLDHMRKILTKD